jgi:simple sugar transport system ATP-binding protein
MEDIRKRFGHAVALDGAHLSLLSGEVHAVLGANGAGKTTLLSVLAGLVSPDAGRVKLREREVRIPAPRDAWAMGIGLVHQHFQLVHRFSALENLALGRGGFRLDLRGVRREARELMDRTGLEVPLDAMVETLGVGQRQRVEIIKVLMRRPNVLILDEPTAVLAPAEVERLLDLLRGLAREGRTVVLVAHKLDEVLSVADRVTVLRSGRTVLEAPRAEVDARVLVEAMVGVAGSDEAAEVEAANRPARPVMATATQLAKTADSAATPAPTSVSPADRDSPIEAPANSKPSEELKSQTPAIAPTPRRSLASSTAPVIARLRDVSVKGARGEVALVGVNLDVRRGEIVGVAGVEGNGQRELAQVLSGRLEPDAGVADLPADPAYIPQDRTLEGLIAEFTLAENMALALHRSADYRRGPILRWGAVRERTRQVLEAFTVIPSVPDAPARALSGGNQQRVVAARELSRVPELLVAENPTRGLDVAASAFVHRRLRDLPESAVVLVSTDLDEVLRLSDRVLVLVRGRLHPVPDEARTRDGVGRLMLAGFGAGRAGERPA